MPPIGCAGCPHDEEECRQGKHVERGFGLPGEEDEGDARRQRDRCRERSPADGQLRGVEHDRNGHGWIREHLETHKPHAGTAEHEENAAEEGADGGGANPSQKEKREEGGNPQPAQDEEVPGDGRRHILQDLVREERPRTVLGHDGLPGGQVGGPQRQLAAPVRQSDEAIDRSLVVRGRGEVDVVRVLGYSGLRRTAAREDG